MEPSEPSQETPEPSPDVEPDEPTSEPDAQPAEPEPDEQPAEPEPAPEQPPAVTEKQIEAMFVKLEKEADRHAGRVSDIMGEASLALVPCPLCPPALPGFLNTDDPIPDEVVMAVKMLLGEPPEPEYRKAIDARKCDACDGLGRVLTGSLVPEQRTKMCSACNGCGYRVVGGPEGAGNGQTTSAPSPIAAQPAPDSERRDPWNRTPDNPDYGRMPGYEPVR